MSQLRKECDRCATISIGNALFIKLSERKKTHPKFEALRYARWFITLDIKSQGNTVNTSINMHSKKWLWHK